MKKLLVLFLTLGVLSSVVSACMGDLGPAGEKGIPAGVSFYTSAQGLQFFFVDEDGNDLVDLDERHSWPLAFPQKVESTTRESAITRATTEAHNDGRVFYVYNDNCNALCKDYDSGLYGFSTYLWGRTVEPEYTTYIYKGSTRPRPARPAATAGWSRSLPSSTTGSKCSMAMKMGRSSFENLPRVKLPLR